jgi:nucleoside phosphorylase
MFLLFLFFSHLLPSCPDASVKDMEAAAVAWAAELYEVPYFALKVVTDIGACVRACVRA